MTGLGKVSSQKKVILPNQKSRTLHATTYILEILVYLTSSVYKYWPNYELWHDSLK